MTDSDKPNDDEKKIVVDTDWKEQVAKEKEQAAAKAATNAQSKPTDDFVAMDKSAAATTPDNADDNATGNDTLADDTMADDNAHQNPPPASLEVLISMLFTQAMACLGQVPNPTTGKAEVNKPFAKHYIDTIEMLSEKTKGNTTEDENKMLNEALHALRMGYVSVKG